MKKYPPKLIKKFEKGTSINLDKYANDMLKKFDLTIALPLTLKNDLNKKLYTQATITKSDFRSQAALTLSSATYLTSLMRFTRGSRSSQLQNHRASGSDDRGSEISSFVKADFRLSSRIFPIACPARAVSYSPTFIQGLGLWGCELEKFQIGREAEYIAASEAAKEVAWLKNFIGDLDIVRSISEPIKKFSDNEGAVVD
ncbi:hypothetical protein OSB04_019160 [Centaurea solstitialis]|uniref:Uncharacterized protein n=1 Tax=Centaurea solstitialis TaxID=347529 RepID=A0AA38W4S5_9ASTR|nr:hypothetical protein OSB04_019160 [Centaurea solstitialis]